MDTSATCLWPSDSAAEEERALEVSLAAGVNLIDTAEMCSNGASERRVGELLHGKDVLVATKFPPSPFSRTFLGLKSFQRRWKIVWRAWNAVPLTCINTISPQNGYQFQGS